jgi:ABC-type multidrug transport system fused ATPase/permease subunit
VVKFEEFLQKRTSPRNLTHDVKSVSQIYSSREGKTIDTLDNKFSVFITHGSSLSKTVSKFFTNDKVIGKIPLVTTEKWMSTIAWFKKPNAFPDMPISLVVSSAYSVVFSDDKFWSSFITKLNKLEKRGDLNEEDFMLVRWDSGLVELAHNASIKSGENYTDEDIYDIVKGIKDKITGSHNQEIKNIKSEHEDKLGQIKGNHEKVVEVIGSELDTTKGNLETANATLSSLGGKIDRVSGVFSYIISWSFNIVFILAVLYGLYLSSTQSQVVGVIGVSSLGILLILTFFNLYIGTEIKKTSQKLRLYVYNGTRKSLNKLIE